MNKTHQTVFRQTQNEYEKLRKDAFVHEMSVSEYIRYLIQKERNMKKEN